MTQYRNTNRMTQYRNTSTNRNIYNIFRITQYRNTSTNPNIYNILYIKNELINKHHLLYKISMNSLPKNSLLNKQSNQASTLVTNVKYNVLD